MSRTRSEIKRFEQSFMECFLILPTLFKHEVPTAENDETNVADAEPPEGETDVSETHHVEYSDA